MSSPPRRSACARQLLLLLLLSSYASTSATVNYASGWTWKLSNLPCALPLTFQEVRARPASLACACCRVRGPRHPRRPPPLFCVCVCLQRTYFQTEARVRALDRLSTATSFDTPPTLLIGALPTAGSYLLANVVSELLQVRGPAAGAAQRLAARQPASATTGGRGRTRVPPPPPPPHAPLAGLASAVPPADLRGLRLCERVDGGL